MSSFCSAKAPHNFSAKNITAVDFVSTVRLNESSAYDFVKLLMFKQLGQDFHDEFRNIIET